MRLVKSIGVPGIALVAVTAVLAGCGGGPGNARDRLHALEHFRCETGAVEHQLRALETGISATKREFEASEPGPAREQILRSMQENALIHRQLPSLEHCPERALPLAEGKSVPEPPAPPTPRRIAVGHRLGAPRVEPGEQALPASPCQAYGKGGTTTVYVYSDSSGCARVAPGERLRIANYTGLNFPAEAVAVRVRVGDYELWLGPHQEGLIPAPVETYLGRGTHSVGAVGGHGPTVLLLPRVCAIRPAAKPGEELCFR
jgi:hypothetical protein